MASQNSWRAGAFSVHARVWLFLWSFPAQRYFSSQVTTVANTRFWTGHAYPAGLGESPIEATWKFRLPAEGGLLCALRHGIHISMEAILPCHPARATESLDWVAKSCERWRIRTGPILKVSEGGVVYRQKRVFFLAEHNSPFVHSLLSGNS